MKRIFIFLFACMMLSNLNAQTPLKTYSGDMKCGDDILGVESSTVGEGSYSYYEKDGKRVKHGNFRFSSTRPYCSLKGKYVHGKKQGLWIKDNDTVTYHNNSLKGPFAINIEKAIYYGTFDGKLVTGNILIKGQTKDFRQVKGILDNRGKVTGKWDILNTQNLRGGYNIPCERINFYSSGVLLMSEETDFSSGETTTMFEHKIVKDLKKENATLSQIMQEVTNAMQHISNGDTIRIQDSYYIYTDSKSTIGSFNFFDGRNLNQIFLQNQYVYANLEFLCSQDELELKEKEKEKRKREEALRIEEEKKRREENAKRREEEMKSLQSKISELDALLIKCINMHNGLIDLYRESDKITYESYYKIYAANNPTFFKSKLNDLKKEIKLSYKQMIYSYYDRQLQLCRIQRAYLRLNQCDDKKNIKKELKNLYKQYHKHNKYYTIDYDGYLQNIEKILTKYNLLTDVATDTSI